MRTNGSTRRPTIETVAYLALFTIIGVTLFLVRRPLMGEFQSLTGIAPGVPLPTASVPRATLPPYQPPIEQPAIAPVDAIADYNATAEAQYRAAVNAAPLPNVNLTGDTAPSVRQTEYDPHRRGAGENVPTALPLPQPGNSGATGTHRAPPINVQETRTCLHGQVWTAAGCRNPNP